MEVVKDADLRSENNAISDVNMKDRAEIMAAVLDSVAETLNIPVADITEETLIRADLEADSMDIVTLMVLLDDKFDAEFNPEDIPADDVSIGWVVDYVSRKLEKLAKPP